jgi:hypothetical protein
MRCTIKASLLEAGNIICHFRYATLVDPYVSNMATCLRDPAPIIRRQTLELLTGLLQVKLSLIFQFLTQSICKNIYLCIALICIYQTI